MTTQLFFQNGTCSVFELYDIDGNHYATVRNNKQYSLFLPYSVTFEKGYKLVNPSVTLFFNVTINGLIGAFSSSAPSVANIAATHGGLGNIFDLNKVVIYTGGILPPTLPPIPSEAIIFYDYY